MSAEPTPAPTEDDAEYYRRVLHRFVDISLDLAEMIHADARAQTEHAPDTLLDAATSIDRLSRGARRSIALARRLNDPAPADRSTSTRKQVLREVEDAIHRAEKRPLDKDILQAELHERLDAPEFAADLDRPVPEIIAEICRDLGIAGPPGPQPWKRRTPEDLAALTARPAARPHKPEPAPPRHTSADPDCVYRLFPNTS